MTYQIIEHFQPLHSRRCGAPITKTESGYFVTEQSQSRSVGREGVKTLGRDGRRSYLIIIISRM